MTLLAVIFNWHMTWVKSHKSGLILLGSIVGFLAYLASGSGVFMILEGDEYENQQRAVLDAKAKIMKKYPTLPAEVLDDFVDELRIIGIRGLPKRNTTIQKWGFSQSWFFVTTLVTTVGYGHFTPGTMLGKIFCIVYTAIGIPITLIHLATYVDFLLKISEVYKATLFRQYRGTLGAFYIRLLHVCTIMSLIVMICFIIPAFFFSTMEKKWKLFDGVYFNFISLTTVGLGDLVPGLDNDVAHPNLYRFIISFYLIFGITIIMFMMAMCGDFCRNYRNDYQQLPFTVPAQLVPAQIVPTEKFPINPGQVHTYGSILSQSGRSESDEKCIVKYDQLTS